MKINILWRNMRIGKYRIRDIVHGGISDYDGKYAVAEYVGEYPRRKFFFPENGCQYIRRYI
jgi:hypothetical protein